MNSIPQQTVPVPKAAPESATQRAFRAPGPAPTPPHAAPVAVSQANVLDEATPVLDVLKTRIGEVLEELDDEITRGIDVSKVLGLNRALGWAIHRVVTAPNGLSAAAYFPSPATLRRFLFAAGEKGVSASTIGRVYEAYATFEALARRHARDQASFAALIRDLQGEESTTDHLKLRRTAYRVQQQLFGVHADAFVHLSILAPARDPELIEHVNVKGWIGIQRLKSSSALLSENATLLKGGDGHPLPTPRPLDSDNALDIGVSPIERFCSRPLPRFESYVDNDALITQAFSDEIGKRGAHTYFLASVGEEPFRSKSHPTFKAFRSYNTLPTAVILRDIWIHRSMTGGAPPYAELYHQRRVFLPDHSLQVEDMLSQQASVDMLGTGIQADLGREIPRYPEMICYIAEKVKCRIEEFYLYRCRVEYPVLNSLVRVVVPLPE